MTYNIWLYPSMRNSIVGIIQTTTKATTFDDKIRSRSEPPTENRCGFSLLLLRKSPRITYPLAVYFVSSRPLLPVARALQPWLLSSPGKAIESLRRHAASQMLPKAVNTDLVAPVSPSSAKTRYESTTIYQIIWNIPSSNSYSMIVVQA